MASSEDTVRRGYKAFGEGDMETLRSIYTSDVVHNQAGDNQAAGEYKGVDDVLAFYGRLFELSDGTLSLDLKSVKTVGDKVVAVHGVKAQRDGKTLDGDERMEFTFAGDKVSRLDGAYLDKAAADAFWGQS